MTNGPIEFLGEEPGHEVPDSEYTGGDGLIQRENDTRLLGDAEASGGHVLDGERRETVGEVHGMMSRIARTPLSSRESWTGEPDEPGRMFDPHTGLEMPEDLNKESSGDVGELSDLKP